MTHLFLGKIQQIDAAINDREQRLEVYRKQISLTELEVSNYKEQRQKIIATKDFCESVLHQVKAALAMLYKVDSEQVTVFENTIKAQFKLDPNTLTEEEYWQKVAKPEPNFKVTGSFKAVPLVPLNSPVSIGTPTAPQATAYLQTIKTQQWQFFLIREKLTSVGIEVKECYWNESNEKRWVLLWEQQEARLVWLNNKGWKVEPFFCGPFFGGSQTLQGIWQDFNLNVFLQSKGVNISSWIALPFSVVTNTHPITFPITKYPLLGSAKQQMHFQLIREKLESAGIEIHQFHGAEPGQARWVLVWKEERIFLVYSADEGWRINRNTDKEELGIWRNFDLHNFLIEKGLNIRLWGIIPSSPGITTYPVLGHTRQQWQFELIREKLELAEIQVKECYFNQKNSARWMLRWGEDEARLVWSASEGWSVKLCAGVETKEQAGMWYGFDLNEFLKDAGVDISSWHQNHITASPFVPPAVPKPKPLDEADTTFTDIAEQRHFKIIQEKFDLAGIKIIHCFMNRPEAKRWLIELKGDEARLVWNEDEGWEVESMDEDNDELIGEWTRFNLPKFLKASGVDTYSWYSHSWGS